MTHAETLQKLRTVLEHAEITKAELDPFTAVQTTLCAVGERVWAIRDAFRAGDMTKTQAEAKGVVDMLSSAVALMSSAAPAAVAAAEKNTEVVTLTAPELLTWAETQTAAAKLESPAVAQKRIAHLGAVLAVAKAANFETESAAPQPFPFTMLTAFAPFSGKDGASLGLTVNADQKVENKGTGLPPSAVDASGFSSTTTTPPAYASGGGAAGLALPAEPTGQSTFDAGGGVSPLGKAAPAAAYAWPLDLNAAKGSTFGEDDPAAVAKSDTWGKDSAKGRLLVAKKRSAVTKRAASPLACSTVVGKSFVTFDLAPSPLVIPVALDVALRAGTTATVSALVGVTKAATAFEEGASLDDLRELFVSKDSGVTGGILLLRRRDDGNWDARMSKTTLPFVLSREAIDKGILPPPGESWLPASIASVIPKRMRFWELSGEAATSARLALVDSGLVAEDLIKLVDGELRICTIRHYLFTPDPEETPAAPGLPSMAKSLPTIFAKLSPDTVFIEATASTIPAPAVFANPEAIVFLTASDDAEATKNANAIALSQSVAAWLLLAPDTNATRDAFAKIGKLFKVEGGSDAIFVASFPPPANVAWVDPVAVAKPVATPDQCAKAVRFLKAEAAPAEERFVLGVVLEPETVDAQNDVYSAEEIRTAAHKFMADFADVKLMHSGEAINDKVRILESYVAPVDFKVGEQIVKAGTWLMAVKILDDDLWASAKSGDLTGFSIGGSAMRAPDAPAALLTRRPTRLQTSKPT